MCSADLWHTSCHKDAFPGTRSTGTDYNSVSKPWCCTTAYPAKPPAAFNSYMIPVESTICLDAVSTLTQQSLELRAEQTREAQNATRRTVTASALMVVDGPGDKVTE